MAGQPDVRGLQARRTSLIVKALNDHLRWRGYRGWERVRLPEQYDPEIISQAVLAFSAQNDTFCATYQLGTSFIKIEVPL
jgi:hypothetical protein